MLIFKMLANLGKSFPPYDEMRVYRDCIKNPCQTNDKGIKQSASLLSFN